MSLLPRDDSLTIEDKQEIDRLCMQFENEWLSGERPALERYLCHMPPLARPALLGELLLIELDYRRSLRERPRTNDYLSRFPRFAEVIGTAFEETFQREVVPRFVPGSHIGRYEVRRMLGAGASRLYTWPGTDSYRGKWRSRSRILFCFVTLKSGNASWTKHGWWPACGTLAL